MARTNPGSLESGIGTSCKGGAVAEFSYVKGDEAPR